MAALLESEDRVLAQLRTFGKAFAASDGACLFSSSLQSSRFMTTADAYQAYY
jgi:7-keto-8-aminopelargonate synthetase-like enzyme